MKLILFLLCLSITTVSFGQGFSFLNRFQKAHGFRYLEKAEKLYVKNKYDRSLQFLNKAEHASFGFCGNAYVESHQKINALRFFIHKQSGNDHLALKSICPLESLDSIHELDSLKMIYFLKIMSKKELRTQFQCGLDSIFNTDFVKSSARLYNLQSMLSIPIKTAHHTYELYFSKRTLEYIDQRLLVQLKAGNMSPNRIVFFEDLSFYQLIMP